ncbi:hypothetical protein PCANC_18024 [Puccinia coronata f. sp. avenae]|uniref:Uncharacterized protein n=1 Tax=Puccinia coronata f. sp. avenae TaxID=200324 RepID=A0A2N5SJ22_9BASI|nr:hypothetical protein PCANC_18024 [Puccinia coronata f. sp. avenae]
MESRAVGLARGRDDARRSGSLGGADLAVPGEAPGRNEESSPSKRSLSPKLQANPQLATYLLSLQPRKLSRQQNKLHPRSFLAFYHLRRQAPSPYLNPPTGNNQEARYSESMSESIQEISQAMRKKDGDQQQPNRGEGSQEQTSVVQKGHRVAPQAKCIPAMGKICIPRPKPKLTPTAARQETATGKDPATHHNLGAGDSDSESETDEEVETEEEESDDQEQSNMEELMAKAICAEKEGDREGAEMYYAMYKSTKEPAKCKCAATPQEWYEEPEIDEDSIHKDEEKAPAPLRQEEEESEVHFVSGAMPKHNDMGFTPYFNKNIRELRGHIPLTIFKRTWKKAVIIHHAEKRSRLDNLNTDRNWYTGYPYPSKWTQLFSKWTINHREFYLTIRNVYKYGKMARWILKHKCNTDDIQAEEGFMVALQYNIQIRANAFAHRVTLPDGSTSVADISIMREKFNNVNPYAAGEAREDWDPTTGTKKTTPAAKAAAQPEAGPFSGSRAATPKPAKQSSYKNSNFDPNYSQCYREKSQQEKRGEEKREQKK